MEGSAVHQYPLGIVDRPAVCLARTAHACRKWRTCGRVIQIPKVLHHTIDVLAQIGPPAARLVALLPARQLCCIP